MKRMMKLTLLIAIAQGLSISILAVEKNSEKKTTKKVLQVADYLDWERASGPQISPDGKRVVYTRSWVDKINDTWTSELWMINVDGSKHRKLCKGSSAIWSPDGTRIAYLDKGEPSGSQIFVRWMDDEGATSQVTRLSESPGTLDWSPDGKQIAFTMFVPKKSKWKIEMPAPPKGAKWTKAPRIVETTHYRQDRRGFMRDAYKHLFVVSADGGTARQLTEGNWNVGSRFSGMDFGAGIDWTPDGSEIVFDGMKNETAETRYRESHIYAIDVNSKSIRQITSKKGPWASPTISHDGKLIAFTGFDWTEQTYKTGELYVIGRDGSGMKKISADLDRDPGSIFWKKNNSGVYFTVSDRGNRNIITASLSGNVKKLSQGNHMLSLSSISDNGMAVGNRSSYHETGDVVAYGLSKPNEPNVMKELTHLNDDVLADRTLGDVEEIWYESTGGVRIQGWIVKPPNFDPNKKYPMILHIHGGPHGMYNVGFNFSFQHLAANGYVVLYTNPRGSTGYGTDFGNAIDNAYPSVDYDDLMAGVDTVIKKGYIDENRLYATGVSGGGVLSSWIVGHTNRFAGAAVRAPVTNWISFAGTTDITVWGFYRFRKPYWEDPNLWLKHSPIMYVKNVKTPTMLMCGELDLRTPMSQSEEFYQALRQLGVPTALIRFNSEYHGTGSKPSNMMRTQMYLLKWFGDHRKGTSTTASTNTVK